ncbi:MFS transporter [Planctomonas sp. JC2975]|uniref:MFS transporter n=1 Tax=Planctomonas sp. JC2975 TaxID=2729626 RepID=UPI0017FDC52E|nr:MFS transporter [Planctomonas sp. JC2975]NNC12794.1 MFS transporter [Planctomonas sp. JC2975]
MFRSLSSLNYRIWFAGALVSNVGTWMQRTAQDWIVLTQLTHNDALAVGVVMALQFGPQLLLLPVTGWVADRFDRRKLMMATQGAMGLLGLGLGILTVTGAVTLWEVYLFALLLGVVAAFDAPARQTFVGDLVGGKLLGNAVALNSASFNAARLIGPAVAGLLTAAVGAGWVFLINAASFAAVLASLSLMRRDQLHASKRAGRARGNLVEGFRYVRGRPDLLTIFLMVFLIGTFGLNFPIFVASMASTVFHKGAGEYGILSSIMAVGSVVGALLAARREKPRGSLLAVAAIIFGIGCLAAAAAPGYWFFGAMLAVVGVASQTFNTTANGVVQLSTDPAVRGRVMAIYMAIFMGGTPIGAPIVGWVADAFGPRWALVVGAASGILAAAVGIFYMVKYRGMRLAVTERRLRFTFASPTRPLAVVEMQGDEVAADKASA